MRAHLITALAIVVASGVAGVAANNVWYKMDWLREKKGVTTPPPKPSTTETNGPCDPSKSKPGFVLIDCVLEHLANGTATFIDARESHDYDESRLLRAYHLPSSAIYDSIEGLYGIGVLEDQMLIIYCGGGNCEASHNVADALRNDFNFTNVFIYEKGWEEVEASGRFGEYIETGVVD
ncbi:MAG: rhodanese-like domain-containing protein [Phycisphaerales bacterium]|nr:rhodanese-like domain-containing protein [Phycisphaerales bacterium]